MFHSLNSFVLMGVVVEDDLMNMMKLRRLMMAMRMKAQMVSIRWVFAFVEDIEVDSNRLEFEDEVVAVVMVTFDIHMMMMWTCHLPFHQGRCYYCYSWWCWYW